MSWADRVKKAARYDDHGQPARNRENQLFPIEDAIFRPLDAPCLTKAYRDYRFADGLRLSSQAPPLKGVARVAGKGRVQGMDRDVTVADLRAMLAVKRQMLEEHDLGRVDLPNHELHLLQRRIHEDEQALRDLGVEDV